MLNLEYGWTKSPCPQFNLERKNWNMSVSSTSYPDFGTWKDLLFWEKLIWVKIKFESWAFLTWLFWAKPIWVKIKFESWASLSRSLLVWACFFHYSGKNFLSTYDVSCSFSAMAQIIVEPCLLRSWIHLVGQTPLIYN